MYLLIQNRLQYFFTISPPLSLMSARPVLPSFSWFHTLQPNIGVDMSRNKKLRIVSPQTIASTAAICVMLPRRPGRILPIRTNTVQMAVEVLALISSLTGRSLCFSSGYLTCRVLQGGSLLVYCHMHTNTHTVITHTHTHISLHTPTTYSSNKHFV